MGLNQVDGLLLLCAYYTQIITVCSGLDFHTAFTQSVMLVQFNSLCFLRKRREILLVSFLFSLLHQER